MGASMCGHLVDAGHRVTVFSRTQTKAEPLVDRGATWAGSPREAAEGATIVFSMVGFPRDVREVYLGEQGVLPALSTGAITIDMTTTSPSLSRQIYQAAQARGVSAIDAPVSGGDVGARNATLSIMVGGDRAAVDAVMPLLQLMGKTIVYEGAAGAGQHTKLCNQIVVAGTMIGVCESLFYGQKAGLDLKKALQAISGGAAACWALDNLAPRILQGNYDPGFFVDHFVKDMGLALEESRRLGIALPGLALVHEIYQRVQALGHGRKGTHALMLALEEMTRASDVAPAAETGARVT
jgi:3-hydroxyisobutyrate dehydrogenase